MVRCVSSSFFFYCHRRGYRCRGRALTTMALPPPLLFLLPQTPSSSSSSPAPNILLRCRRCRGQQQRQGVLVRLLTTTESMLIKNLQPRLGYSWWKRSVVRYDIHNIEQSVIEHAYRFGGRVPILRSEKLYWWRYVCTHLGRQINYDTRVFVSV